MASALPPLIPRIRERNAHFCRSLIYRTGFSGLSARSLLRRSFGALLDNVLLAADRLSAELRAEGHYNRRSLLRR